ncbi:MAG TPA: MraY family glycosyltransferase [Flavitalea sp.]|nr:MraY family glycosyltransferase [Flavitalea sp.]
MFDVLQSIAVSFAITFLAIPAIITVAERKKLFDVPDERKIHKMHTPSLGGLGIFAGFVMTCLLSISFTIAPELQYFLAAAIVLFFLGLKDDILVISPIKKFIGQVIAAFLIIYKGGLQITSMHGFLGIYELPEMFSLLLTYFTIIVIINSFNLIDGIDGLAGSLGVMAAALFGFYFLRADLMPYAIMAFALAGSLIAFLIFNYHPARIFMGDTGSMLIGMVTAILAIKFINVAEMSGASSPVREAPAIGFTILLVPLMDTLRVFGIRIFHRRSPFIPDRNHIHHLMLDKGLSHTAITLILVTANLLFVGFSYYFRGIGAASIIVVEACLFFGGIAALYYTRPRPKLFVTKVDEEKEAGITKIVPLTKDALVEHNN